VAIRRASGARLERRRGTVKPEAGGAQATPKASPRRAAEEKTATGLLGGAEEKAGCSCRGAGGSPVRHCWRAGSKRSG